MTPIVTVRRIILCLPISLGFGRMQAQQPPRPPPCPAAQLQAFDFLVGSFHGVVYDFTGPDSTATGVTARVSAERVLSGCALLERWHFEQNGAPEADVVVLRAYDAASNTWSYDIATAQLEHVTWVGSWEGGGWYFGHDFVSTTGTVRARIRWTPQPGGYTEEVSRSRDGGATWIITRHINFVREKGSARQ